ncbi:MAG TPA: BON domain-containing protein [Planctomycetaceae bacterium]|nr:BON domain-containing protein [Planctomycetaceae bacterium]
MEELSQLDTLDACDSASDTASTLFTLHELEHTVQRELLAQPDLDFSSLVVRRIPGGVCLEGVLETCVGASDVTSLARRVAGVQQVLNHLVIRRPARHKG